jgi:hypothetical protein
MYARGRLFALWSEEIAQRKWGTVPGHLETAGRSETRPGRSPWFQRASFLTSFRCPLMGVKKGWEKKLVKKIYLLGTRLNHQRIKLGSISNFENNTRESPTAPIEYDWLIRKVENTHASHIENNAQYFPEFSTSSTHLWSHAGIGKSLTSLHADLNRILCVTSTWTGDVDVNILSESTRCN